MRQYSSSFILGEKGQTNITINTRGKQCFFIFFKEDLTVTCKSGMVKAKQARFLLTTYL